VFPRTGWPLSSKELEFAQSIIRDLSVLGYDLSIEDDVIRYSQKTPAATEYRNFYHPAHEKLHRQVLKAYEDRILAIEREFGDIFTDGKRIEFSAIQPRLRSVDLRQASGPAERDCAIVEYVRLYQTVASRGSVGRENAYIVEDMGNGGVVIGVLVLSSPRYFQPLRDEFLGWQTPKQLRALRQKEREQRILARHAGLARMMQVSVCCALPPYSRLGAARLLATAPFTDLVRSDFASRWQPKYGLKASDLAMVTTTTSMGLTGTPFQNIRAKDKMTALNLSIRGNNWNREGNVYSRLGDIHPWVGSKSLTARGMFASFHSLVSDGTMGLARRLFDLEQEAAVSPAVLLNRAISRVGLSPRIFRGNPMGMFVGALNRESIEAVAAGNARPHAPVLSWDLAVRKFTVDFRHTLAPTEIRDQSTRKRVEAALNRIDRAKSVTLRDVLLSNRLNPDSPAQPVTKED
jgi:hypothetical protein